MRVEPSVTLVTAERFYAAPTFDEFVQQATKNQDFWRSVHQAARIPADLAERVRAIPARWHLLALVEDWCGDAVNAVPLVARLVEHAPAMDLRLLPRDANPDIMDAHLTHGTRSIPVVMVFDDTFTEQDWWGPRPGPLQAWFYETGRVLEKPERTRLMREWYARDRGRTTASEIVALLEGAAARRAAGGSSSPPPPG